MIEIPSADVDVEDLIIKGAKGIQDGLYNITDGKLFKYKAKGGTVRTYPIVPSADADCSTCKHKDKDWDSEECDSCCGNNNHYESADAEQGEWIEEGEYAECSMCGAHSGTQFDGVEPIPLKTNFCPNCGARMKGGEDE